jgi:predicted dehydrogenase
MRVVIVGLGIQGRKRMAVAGVDVAATVDPLVPEARYRSIEEVPLETFEAALVCTPDTVKLPLLRHLLSHGKHVLVEKPLLAEDSDEIRRLDQLARANGVACYTAYNHRFEPHIVRLKSMLEAGTIGPVYLLRMFYGNGTARDVRESAWRDEGAGVLSDLGSHLLDITAFLLGRVGKRFQPLSFNRFENRAFDHVLFGAGRASCSARHARVASDAYAGPVIELEGTLLSWRNTFTLDVYGEQGSAHINGLCKWGPSRLILRKRVLPSGKPEEQVQTLEQPDPTWALEYEHFKRLCQTGGTNLDNDMWINDVLKHLVEAIYTTEPQKSTETQRVRSTELGVWNE